MGWRDEGLRRPSAGDGRAAVHPACVAATMQDVADGTSSAARRELPLRGADRVVRPDSGASDTNGHGPGPAPRAKVALHAVEQPRAEIRLAPSRPACQACSHRHRWRRFSLADGPRRRSAACGRGRGSCWRRAAGIRGSRHGGSRPGAAGRCGCSGRSRPSRPADRVEGADGVESRAAVQDDARASRCDSNGAARRSRSRSLVLGRHDVGAPSSAISRTWPATNAHVGVAQRVRRRRGRLRPAAADRRRRGRPRTRPAAARPRLRAAACPRSAGGGSGHLMVTAATRAVSSVEPSSTTITSTAGSVCRRALSMASPR